MIITKKKQRSVTRRMYPHSPFVLFQVTGSSEERSRRHDDTWYTHQIRYSTKYVQYGLAANKRNNDSVVDNEHLNLQLGNMRDTYYVVKKRARAEQNLKLSKLSKSKQNKKQLMFFRMLQHSKVFKKCQLKWLQICIMCSFRSSIHRSILALEPSPLLLDVVKAETKNSGKNSE